MKIRRFLSIFLLAVLLAIGIVWAAVRERKLKKGGAAKC